MNNNTKEKRNFGLRPDSFGPPFAAMDSGYFLLVALVYTPRVTVPGREAKSRK